MKVMMSVRVEGDLRKRLRKLALDRNQTLAELIENLAEHEAAKAEKAGASR